MSHFKHLLRKTFAFAVLLLVIGGINLGYMSMFKNDLISSIFGKRSLIATILYIAICIAALSIAFFRDTYLPFLGPSVMPCSLLSPRVPENANYEVSISVHPGQKIMYWAAEPENNEFHHIQDWKHAYLKYKNAGVTIADDAGVAILKVRKPQAYTVPFKGELSPHIHYRTCKEDGFIGKVHTVSLKIHENFLNFVSAQEQNEAVQESKAPIIPNPKDALSEINRLAIDTLGKSHMAESGASEEHMPSLGADLTHAFSTRFA